MNSIDVGGIAAAIITVGMWVIQATLKGVLEEAVLLLRQRTGIAVSQAAADKVAAYFSTLAGLYIAKGDANILDAKIDVKDPEIAKLANKAIAEIPDDLATAGITQAQVTDRIVGAIGKLQAVPAAAAPKETTK
jgi:hypothetical protein